MDDVSVHSILASRTGGIATQFTKSQQSSATSDTGISTGIGLGATKATMDTKLRSVDSRDSEVLSKAVIQTNFKELYELERDKLTVRVIDKSATPESVGNCELGRMLGQENKTNGWVLDVARLSRGDLIEVELALEADPIFHIVSVFSTVMSVFEDNEHLLGYEVVTQLPQFASIVRVLEGLLEDLVPVRGRLVNYKYTTHGDRDVLIHQKVIDQMSMDDLPPLRSAYVVGVAERGLFWKNVRRVLFSGAEYTAFCRVATEGVSTSWHPIKVANVLRGIAPDFDEAMVNLSDLARRTIWDRSDSTKTTSDGNQQDIKKILLAYAKSVADHLDQPLTSEARESIGLETPESMDWLSRVDNQRPVFARVTEIVEEALGKKGGVDGETGFKLRRAALEAAVLSGTVLGNEGSVAQTGERQPASSDVVFLDTEIIAIYW